MRPVHAALVGTLLVLVLLVPLADAHASRVPGSETPAAGSRLTAIPAEVSLVVAEPVAADGTYLRVTRSDGVRVDVGGTRIDGASTNTPRLTVSVRSDAGDGAYTVGLQTLSTADGHPWTESYGFAVGDFEPPAIVSEDGVPLLTAFGRFLAFTGLALGFGAGLFLLWMPGSGAKWGERLVHEPLLAAGLAHTAGLALIIHATADTSGLALRVFAASDVGRLLVVRLLLGLGALALALLAFPAATRTRSGPIFAVLLLLLAGLGSSRLGHASLHGVAGVATDYMHLLSTATWAGGLLVLLWVLVNSARGLAVDEVRRIGLRFGTAALTCVLLLALTGTAATILIAGPDTLSQPGELFASGWGKFLAAKVGLTIVMVGLAGVNRFVFLESPRSTGPVAALQRAAGRLWRGARSLHEVADASALRRVVLVEATLGLAILLVAGALTAVSPPSDAQVPDTPLLLTSSGDAHHVALTLDPRPVVGGLSDLDLVVQTHTNQAVTADTCGRSGCITATVRYGADAAAEGGESRAFTPNGDGTWGLDGVLWTQAGEATITVRVQTAEVFEDLIVLYVGITA